MKLQIMIASACALTAMQLDAQNLVDATRFSSTNINGTARYNSMAGAFGAVGGDASSMVGNPAGTAIFRNSSEVSVTTNFATARTSANDDVRNNQKKHDFAIGNLSYILSVKTDQCEHLVNYTIGLGFNHSEGVNRRYAVGLNGLTANSSLAGYAAHLTNRSLINSGKFDTPDYLSTNAAWSNSNVDLMSLMAYNSCAVYPNTDAVTGAQTGGVDSYDGMGGYNNYSDLYVREENRTDEYNINMSANWEDFIYAGVTLSIVDFNSIINSEFSEYYNDEHQSYTYYDNDLETKGTGVNLKFGAIIKPTDSWRLGLAIHTPTWYDMKDIYYGAMATNDADRWSETGTYEYDYRFSSPWKYQFSTAYVIGTRGLVSLEYDVDDYRSMRYSSGNDRFDDDFSLQTELIKEYMTEMHTIRIGGELRATPRFSIRAGYAHSTSPYQDKVFNQMYQYDDDGELILSSSTKPNYALQDGTDYVCAGLGWRGQVCYLNLSCVQRTQHEKVAAFPTIKETTYAYGKENITVPGSAATPVSLKTRTLSFDLSLGFRF